MLFAMIRDGMWHGAVPMHRVAGGWIKRSSEGRFVTRADANARVTDLCRYHRFCEVIDTDGCWSNIIRRSMIMIGGSGSRPSLMVVLVQ